MSPLEVDMRALRYSDERCPDCRGGLICAEPWEAWYARADEGALLLDERPDCEEEIECPSCGGTGLRRRQVARTHAA